MDLYVCMCDIFECIYVCIFVHMFVCVSMDVVMHGSVYICIYIHTCMIIHTLTYLSLLDLVMEAQNLGPADGQEASILRRR